MKINFTCALCGGENNLHDPHCKLFSELQEITLSCEEIKDVETSQDEDENWAKMAKETLDQWFKDN